MSFQKDNGLTPDGMVGPNTLSKLGISRSGGGSGTISATLRKGSNGSLTRYLQRILSAL
ncbi:peptidoglycan-binding domain-containing protein, partial [Muricomes intestini]|uniref:peptidoglycan-binding domain-containing protein n=1 Tax=Muricomes intestini TaxID=1796634 RepID=UPI003A5C878D